MLDWTSTYKKTGKGNNSLPKKKDRHRHYNLHNNQFKMNWYKVQNYNFIEDDLG